MSLLHRMRSSGVSEPQPGEYQRLSEYDTLEPDEERAILFAALRELNLVALRVNDGTTTYVVVEKDD